MVSDMVVVYLLSEASSMFANLSQLLEISQLSNEKIEVFGTRMSAISYRFPL